MNNSDAAIKREVNAKIEIDPDDANAVGKDHTFTVTVMQDDGLNSDQGGDGVTGWTAAVGASVDVTLVGLNGAVPVLPGPFNNLPTDGLGQVSVTFTSVSAGLVVGSATADISFARLLSEQPPAGPLVVTRSTDGLATTPGSEIFNSDAAEKTFVDVRIRIGEDGNNVVGNDHPLRIALERSFGDNGTPGNPDDDWAPFTDQDVTASFVGSHVGGFKNNPGVDFVTVNDSDDGVSDGVALVTLVSSLPGVDEIAGSFAGDVFADGNHPDHQLTRTTGTTANMDLFEDVVGEDGGNAFKTWNVGRINLSPASDTNGITESHVITATLEYSDDGVIWQNAPDGSLIAFSLTVNIAGAGFIGAPPPTVGGTTTATITANAAGDVNIAASSSFTVSGIDGTFVVATDAGLTDNPNTFSGPEVEKIYEDGTLRWLKHDQDGVLLPDAEFRVTRTHSWDSTNGFVDIADVSFNPVIDDTDGTDGPAGVGLDQDGTGGEFQLDQLEAGLSGLAMGRYTIEETLAPEGYVLDPTVITVELTLADTDGGTFENPPIFVNELIAGRMTGGGSIFVPIPGGEEDETFRVTHGFQLHGAQPPEEVNNRLQINLHKPYQGSFHLETLTWVKVSDDPDIMQFPARRAPIDTIEGIGEGRFSGIGFDGVRYHKADALVHFILVDGGPERGEPGVDDTFNVIVTVGGVVVLNSDGTTTGTVAVGVDLEDDGALLLHHGNHQAHPEIPPLAPLSSQTLSVQGSIDRNLDHLDNPNLNEKNAAGIIDDLLLQFDELDEALAVDPLLAAYLAEEEAAPAPPLAMTAAAVDSLVGYPGDANLDGGTDVRDFMIWNANKFTSGTNWATGDFNGDNVTDVRDFMIWNAHKFTSAPAPLDVALADDNEFGSEEAGDDLAWLAELDGLTEMDRTSKDTSYAEATVDKLMASYMS